MGAPDLLRHLRADGLTLAVTDAGLIVQPKALLTDARRETIRTNRDDLIAALRAEAEAEAFEERAAIREHDGGMPQPEAVSAACVDLARLSVAQADECHAGGWNDVELVNFTKRRELLLRRGLTDDEADRMAERLILRDRQADDRRMCVECSHLSDRGRCLAAIRIAGADRRLEPVPMLLQRCEAFGLRKGQT